MTRGCPRGAGGRHPVLHLLTRACLSGACTVLIDRDPRRPDGTKQGTILTGANGVHIKAGSPVTVSTTPDNHHRDRSSPTSIHHACPGATYASTRPVISASIATILAAQGIDLRQVNCSSVSYGGKEFPGAPLREPARAGLLRFGERDREFLPLAVSESLHGIPQDTVIPNALVSFFRYH